MRTLTLLRHGHSEWNRERRFTGWADVGLTPRGVRQAKRAGRLLRERGLAFDLCFTSVLSRASRTLELALAAMEHPAVEVRADWKLNERHYGLLQGMTYAEAVRRFGLTRVLRWQRSYDAVPPPVGRDDARFPGNDPLYASVPAGLLPRSESLHDTLERLLPCWREAIEPALRDGKRLLVVAHQNALRALANHLEGGSTRDVRLMHIPTGEPLVYTLDADLRVVSREYLRTPARLWHQFLSAWR